MPVSVSQRDSYKTDTLDDFVDSLQKVEDLTDRQAEIVKRYLESLVKAGEEWSKMVDPSTWNRFTRDLNAVLSSTEKVNYTLEEIHTSFVEMVKEVSTWKNLSQENVSFLRTGQTISEKLSASLYETGKASRQNLASVVQQTEHFARQLEFKRQQAFTELGIEQTLNAQTDAENARKEIYERLDSVQARKAAIEAINYRNRTDAQSKELILLNQKEQYLNTQLSLTSAIAKEAAEEAKERAKFHLEKRSEISGKMWKSNQAIGLTAKLMKGLGFDDAAEAMKAAQEKRIQDRLAAASRVYDAEGAVANLDRDYKNLEQKLKDRGLTEDQIKTHSSILALMQDQEDAQKRLESARKEETSLTEQSGKTFREAILDPIGLAVKSLGFWGLVLKAVLGIWKNFTAVNESAVELKRQTGLWYQNLAGANSEFATSVDWLSMATALSKEYGINMAMALGSDQIARLAEMKNLLGLSEKEAGVLAVLSKINGQTVDKTLKSLEKTVNTTNAQFKSYANLRAVLNDVTNATQDMQARTGNNVENLIKAAAAARALGSSLEGVGKIADSLLDFESSISKQMEAQLLTGMAFNLNQARSAALMGDMEGVAREVANQGITLEKFSSMNVIAQKGIADMLGMSVGEMNEMLQKQKIQQDIARGVSNEQTKQYLANLEAVSVTEQWNKALQKLMQAFTPILNIVITITDAITWIIDGISGIIGSIAGFVGIGAGKGRPGFGFGTMAEDIGPATAELAKLKQQTNGVAESAEKAGNAIYDASGKATTGAQASMGGFTGVLDTVKSWLLVSASLGIVWKRHAILDTLKTVNFALKEAIKNTTLWKTASEGIGKLTKTASEGIGKLTDKVTPKWFKNAAAKRAQQSIAGKATEAGAAAGKGAEGLSSTTQAAARTGARATNMLKGAGAMILFAGALYIFAKAIQEFQKIGWEDFVEGLGKIVIATGVIGGIAALASKVGNQLKTGLRSIAEAIIEFGTTLITGNVATLAGLAGLAAIAGILWLMSPVIEAAGNALKAVLEGIGDIIYKTAAGIGDAISKVVETWYEGKAKVEAIKVDLVNAQAGLATAIGNSITKVIDSIAGLGSLDAINLGLIGPALLSIAGGLTVLSGVSLGSSVLSLFGAGPASELLRLAAAGDGMQVFATAVVTLATAVVTLNAALDRLDTEKLAGLSKIKGLKLEVGNLTNTAIINSGLPVASAPEKTIETVIRKEDKVVQEKTGESNRNSKEILNLQEGLKTINQKFDKLISLVQTPRATTVTLDQRVFDGQVIYGSSL